MTRPKQNHNKTTKVAEMDCSELELLIANAVAAAIKPLTEQIQKLEDELQKLKSDLCEKDEVINSLQVYVDDKCDELEQYGRRNNIRVFGVKEESGENTDNLVIAVAKKIDVHLDPSCIDRSHRVGKPGGRYPRPIIVKFTSYATRSAVFQSKRLLKGSKITIREDLTQARLALMKRAIESYSERCVWSYDGVIMIRIGSMKPLRVKSVSELNDLLLRHPPQNE